MRGRAAGVALALLGTLAVAPGAAAELYRWTDESGVVHYTGDRLAIPARYRAAARPVPHPRPTAAPPAAVAPAAPAAAVPAVGSGAPIAVPVRVNGVTLSLVLDTGADRTVITPAALARAGLTDLAGSPLQIVGVTGSAPATLVTVPVLEVAGARLGPLPVVVHQTPIAAMDGLLGRDVLDAFTVTIDAGAGQAVLTPR
jgi:hypothetical protein